MSFHCGIIGLPNVGKSTLFNALVQSAKAAASNYPFCTIEPNFGTVIVPDKRFDFINQIYKPKKAIPAAIDFVDIAGLVKGASKGEGLGNQFLSHIREVDAVVHIVRCFENDDISHVYEKIDPKNDIEIVETELILKDLETISKIKEKMHKSSKSGDKKLLSELEIVEKLYKHLSDGRMAKYFTKNYDKEIKKVFKTYNLLTDKPVIYVANVGDNELKGNNYSDIVKQIADNEGAKCLILSVEMESEIAQLENEKEKEEFLVEMGLCESAVSRLIKESYSLLDLITFYTVNERELHSWTIKNGTKVPEAGGKIHTDFERGFICAEVIKFNDLYNIGNEHKLKEKGLLHITGKDYIVQDGDIIFYKFNV